MVDNNMEPDYFGKLSVALKNKRRMLPTLLVDMERLNHNLENVSEMTADRTDVRIVVKSLPSIDLLKHASEKLKTDRFMVFHTPFAKHVIDKLPNAELLFGKPMPVDAAQDLIESLDKESLDQITWLIDTKDRAEQYLELAKSKKVTLKIALEINVGLNRGGFEDKNTNDFKFVLGVIKSTPNLEMIGLMGYDAHVVALPPMLAKKQICISEAQKSYRKFKTITQRVFGEEADRFIYNAGGSPTYKFWQKTGIANEISVASVLVKPSDFDSVDLSDHLPAVFIAAPILKTIDKPTLPMLPRLSAFLRLVGKLPSRAGFIYGGKWMAKPCYPASAKQTDVYGKSSNQEMYALPRTANVDDFLFFRPTQSEGVFLQFDGVALYEDGQITKVSDHFHQSIAKG